jgi:hypothetical protein
MNAGTSPRPRRESPAGAASGLHKVPIVDEGAPVGSDWRYVVFADVLGFKSLVRTNNHRQLVGIFSGDIRLIAEFGATGGIAVPGDPAAPDTDVAMVNMRMVSDSIVLWTEGDRPAEFVWLLLAMRRMLMVGVATGVPIRAAMAHGELTHFVRDYDNRRLGADTLIGQALVDAYEAECRQEWAGGVVLDSALRRYEEAPSYGVPTVDDLIRQHLLVRYEAPVKGDDALPGLAVNWPAAFDEPLTLGRLEWAFTEYGKSLDNESARVKFDNTVDFVSGVGCLRRSSGS